MEWVETKMRPWRKSYARWLIVSALCCDYAKDRVAVMSVGEACRLLKCSRRTLPDRLHELTKIEFMEGILGEENDIVRAKLVAGWSIVGDRVELDVMPREYIPRIASNGGWSSRMFIGVDERIGAA